MAENKSIESSGLVLVMKHNDERSHERYETLIRGVLHDLNNRLSVVYGWKSLLERNLNKSEYSPKNIKHYLENEIWPK